MSSFTLNDQQLRAELLRFGETVPPITNRNRPDLLARLEILRAAEKRPSRASPARPRASGPSRSRPVPGLIELSDSDTDAPVRPSQRSIPIPNSPPSTSKISSEVEQSRKKNFFFRRNGNQKNFFFSFSSFLVARHRKEIENLISSARERTLAANSSISSSTPFRSNEPITTPFRSTSSSSSSSSAFTRSKTNVESERKTPAKPSAFQRSNAAIRTFWTQNRELILNILKALLFGILFGGTLILAKNFLPVLIPNRTGEILIENQIEKFIRIFSFFSFFRNHLYDRKCDVVSRNGPDGRRCSRFSRCEVDCGLRPAKDLSVTKGEVQRFLNEKGFKFEEGEKQRWETLIHYIWDKPEDEILVLDKSDKIIAENVEAAVKLRSENSIRPLTCRLRKRFHATLQQLALIALGTSGILSLIWFLKRRATQNREKENAYKTFVDDILQMLENQYEEHLRDPTNTQPWLAISHIRDMLIPVADRKKLKELWQRAQKQISESESRVRAETQVIHGEEFDVWRWIQPKSSSSPSSPRKRRVVSFFEIFSSSSFLFLIDSLSFRNHQKLRMKIVTSLFHRIGIDDDEIDLVVDSIQNRCATVRRIEHIGIHANFVYLKFSTKEGAAQGFHLLNNWRYNGREIVAKYLRLHRYYDHFPEARDSGPSNN
uniref:Nuclear membrane protein XMAN1-like protein n=1 Tax=Philodina roseola TaxID=96448 RepID=B6S335_PHIRO|nr:nuclear membrane protein XMAN1-like protein [Philodina roseola]